MQGGYDEYICYYSTNTTTTTTTTATPAQLSTQIDMIKKQKAYHGIYKVIS